MLKDVKVLKASRRISGAQTPSERHLLVVALHCITCTRRHAAILIVVVLLCYVRRG